MKQVPDFFEHLVVKLLTQMGYGGSVDHAGTVIGQTGDEGIDGIIREDKLGFSLIYIQAKRWDCDKTVGRPEIQKFVGALAGQGASKGLFITTAKFTKEARQYAEKQHTTRLCFVDGTTLAKLMIEYNLGVSTEATYEIKRIDSDFLRRILTNFHPSTSDNSYYQETGGSVFILPEERARVKIDKQLSEAGWDIVMRNEYVPKSAAAVKEALMQGNTESDYLLFC